MKRTREKKGSGVWLAVVALVVVVVLAVVWTQQVVVRDWMLEREYKEDVPSPLPVDDFQVQPLDRQPLADSASSPQPIAAAEVAASDINLDVPFAPQAPLANWGQPYQDACEEATAIMVERYLRGATLSLAEMDAEILKMVDWQQQHYGFFKDSNVAETVRLIEDYFPHLSASAHYDVTEDDIRQALAQGAPVIVLVNGQRLGNPFYTAPGPERHTLVIKGIKGDKFITNDPGTKRGADFTYSMATVLGAMEDYDGNTPGTYKRAMILIVPK